MSKIKIVTDSTGYIKKEFADREDISIVELNYSFDDEICKEGFPGEFQGFFDRLSDTELFPTTSQPSSGEFLSEFERAFREGYEHIIVILLSSKLSGTYNSALLAKNMLEDERITVIDSMQAASNLRFLVEDALDMAKQNRTVDEIVSHIENRKRDMSIYVTVDTLEYLRRGGRLTGLQSALGEVLNIRPIIQMEDGELELLEKVRGKNKAIKSIIAKVPKSVQKIGICHIFNEDESIKLRKDLKSRFDGVEISIDELGPVIGCHLGPKAIGICFY
ncbi:MAG: DegV family protein [Tissierellia bacterium]|nr:DegV family protein [Tissierellia bacterium]